MKSRGFTVVELLIVIGIITVLTTFLVMGLKGAGAKAQGKATKALVERIKVALDNYYGHFRDYPPDGYDDENNGWTIPAQGGQAMNVEGVAVGTPARRLKGTASLIYFLCRPVVKISYSGSPSDPRNIMKETVGPFLDLGPENFTRPGFNPMHPWADDAYWENGSGQQGYRLTEIIDPFYRPLHYDKVKAWGPGVVPPTKYFQPDRFHYFHGSSLTNNNKGKFVHSDQTFLTDQVLPLDDNEMLCPTDTGGGNTHENGIDGVPEGAKIGIHSDPRFITPQFPDGCVVNGYNGASQPSSWVNGTIGSHEPKFVGGYDVWAHGMSYTSPRDDVKSWE
jgi:prepilin-type N-terminal cleavage/methylation domain-containing protein